MSVNVTLNGSVYIIPETNEVGWGGNTTSYLVAIPAGVLQKTGGSFTLSAETDFGASFGLKSLYYKSRNSNIAAAGIVRLNNNSDSINWRNAANSADLSLLVNASNELLYNGNQVLTGTSPSNYVSSITGTANQVNASASTGAVTLSLPQSINTSAGVQFGTLALGGTLTTSAILSLASTSLGFLPPRMTTVQRDVIVTPATGLLIYNTSTGAYNYYNGASWAAIAGGGTINTGTAGFFSYYPATGTTLDDQAILSTDGTNLTIASGQILVPDGTISLPSYSFTSDTNTGMYRVSADALGFTVGGTLLMQLDSTQCYVVPNIRAQAAVLAANGTAPSPAYSFNGDDNTGVYSVSSDILGFSTAGVLAVQIDATQHVQFSAGSAAVPAISFIGDTDTGLYRSGANVLGISSGGSDAMVISSTRITTAREVLIGSVSAPTFDSSTFLWTDGGVAFNIDCFQFKLNTGAVSRSLALFVDSAGVTQFKDGSATAPVLTFLADTNTGFYRPSADAIAVTVGGTATTQFDTTQLFTTVPVKAAAGSVSAPSFTFSADDNTGMYNVAANTLGFTTNGVLAGLFDADQNFIKGSSSAVILSSTVTGIEILKDSGTSNRLIVFHAGASVNNGIIMGTARGTLSSPTLTQSGDSLGALLGRGCAVNGAISSDKIAIRYNATETWSSTANGTQITVDTTPIGSTTLTNVATFATSGCAFQGTTTNDSAATGFIGQYIESLVTTATNTGASGTYFDATSISLTAGDWDITGMISYTANGATFTPVVNAICMITTTSGNDSTGRSDGVNACPSLSSEPLTFSSFCLSVPSFRVSLSSTTTYYLKGFMGTYTAGTPQYKCRVSARRVR